MRFVLLLTLLLPSAAAAQSNPDPETRNAVFGAVENTYFRAMKDDIQCGLASTPGCKDRVVLALGDLTVKAGGKTQKLRRGQFLVFGAGQSYERPVGDHFWEIAIKADHPPVPAPPEVVVPVGSDAIYEGPDFWIYNERLEPNEVRPRHSHTYRAVVQLNANVGGGGGAVLEWPVKSKPAAPPDHLPLTPAQKDAILKHPPRGNDSIAFASPVIHTNQASQYARLDGIVVMMKTADEKAGKGKAPFEKVVKPIPR
jgi:hypothetical protein